MFTYVKHIDSNLCFSACLSTCLPASTFAVLIDGVVHTNVRFFALTPHWPASTKQFPLAVWTLPPVQSPALATDLAASPPNAKGAGSPAAQRMGVSAGSPSQPVDGRERGIPTSLAVPFMRGGSGQSKEGKDTSPGGGSAGPDGVGSPPKTNGSGGSGGSSASRRPDERAF